MGDLFGTNQNTSNQATTSSQVGAQGGGEGSQTTTIGSGTSGTVAAGAGNAAITGSNVYGGIKITSADADVAKAAITGANETATNALASLQMLEESAATTNQNAVENAQQLANNALALSGGESIQSLGGSGQASGTFLGVSSTTAFIIVSVLGTLAIILFGMRKRA